MPIDRLLLRAALRLNEVFLSRAAYALEQTLLNRLARYKQALERIRTSLQQAVATGWPTTAAQVQRSLLDLHQSVRDAVQQTSQQLKQATVPVPDLRGLLAELCQLEDEFDGLEVDLKEKALRVRTQPIELENVYLGPFTVQLGWGRLTAEAKCQCFEIIALEPNPAAANEAVTHPHVSNGTLCAGDAKLPIQHALEQGRLADAFCLVRSVLTHYNPSSPHVPLDAWHGQDCHDCGYSTSPDDLSYCDSCGNDYCEECISSCAACHETRCQGCLDRCPLCEDSFCSACLARSAHSKRVCCRRCLRPCTNCGAQVARDELDPSTHSCPSCLPDEPEPESMLDSQEDMSPAPETNDTESIHEPPETVPAVA